MKLHTDLVVTGRVLTFSKDTIARNPHIPELFGAGGGPEKSPSPHAASSLSEHVPARPSRIRQRSKPLSNQLEAEFGRIIRSLWPDATIWEKGLSFRLANGCVYWTDWVVWDGRKLICHEVKGKKAWDDAIVKLKVAARTFPQFEWFLQDKLDGQWREYRVLP